jgi:hypothetical protein
MCSLPHRSRIKGVRAIRRTQVEPHSGQGAMAIMNHKKRTIQFTLAGISRMHSALAHVTRQPTGGFTEVGMRVYLVIID